MSTITYYQIVFHTRECIVTESWAEIERAILYMGNDYDMVRDYDIEIITLSFDPDGHFCQDDYEYLSHTG